jgi:hypothetical protein
VTAGSAAAHCDDDFQAVSTDQRRIGMLAARNNFTIFLDGDAFSSKPQRLDQLGESEWRREIAGFAIDGQFNHNFYPGVSFSIISDSTLKNPAGHEDKFLNAGVV